MKPQTVNKVLLFVTALSLLTMLWTFPKANEAKHFEDKYNVVSSENEEKDLAIDKLTESENQLKETLSNLTSVEASPFKPSVVLTVKQESLCTKLAVYGETRNSSIEDVEYIMWVVINRAIDSRRDRQYRGTSCGVVKAVNGLQFEGAKGFKVIDDIVWGLRLDYVPKTARTANTPDAIAWDNISRMVDEAYAGKLTRKTLATHFINLQQTTGPVKDWVKDLKPVGVSSNHFLFVDYEHRDGKRVFFTKENPFKVSFDWKKFEQERVKSMAVRDDS